MRRFAGEFDVLFIESLPMRAMTGGDRYELRRAWQKLRLGIRVRTAAPHLYVLRPPPIPPAGRLGRAGQLAGVRTQIAYARRVLHLDGPAVSWFSVPIAAPLRGRLGERGSLFYYQDRYHEFSHVDAPRLRALIGSLARGCDACIATSDELAEDLRPMRADVKVVPHGVDADHFAADWPGPCEELAKLERPLVGYVGLLDDHLAFDLILAIAERLDHGTVVLVGSANTDVSSLLHPRIARLGFRPYGRIPAYLAAFDCCILPFKLNALTLAVDPIKLREYLAAGRPTVSTPLPSATRYSDVVELAPDAETFAAAVIRLLDPVHDSPAARTQRRQRVAGESWDAVAEQIRPILESLAHRSAHGVVVGSGQT
jgi:hypothetical protein